MWIPTRQKFNYKNAAFLLLQKRKSSDTSILFLKETHAQRYSDSSTTFVIAYLSSCEVTGLININLMRTILSQSCTLMDALSSSDLSAPLHRNKKGCNYRNCLSPQMSVFIANWCHEFPSQPIRHHRLLVAWSEGANVNKNNQYIAVLRMDFCFDSSSKWEKEFSFNQWGHWGSKCWKSNWRWMKSHWQAWKPNSCYLWHAQGWNAWCILLVPRTLVVKPMAQMKFINIRVLCSRYFWLLLHLYTALYICK